MECGVRHDWSGDEHDIRNRPAWMRQKPLQPCNCGHCFFCKQGMTDGTCHARGEKRKKKDTSGTKRKIVNECTGLRERFDETSCCGMCYRYLGKSNPELRTEEKKNMVRLKMMPGKPEHGGQPRNGCLNCNERVCKMCWPTYDHYPTKSKQA